MEHKRVLLIAGGGTLGTYTAEELIRRGHTVDIIVRHERHSICDQLSYIAGDATPEFLQELFLTRRYDGIINFLHFTAPEVYAPYHKLLEDNAEHLIFISSYRVYADQQHPITETAPRLLDASDDANFLANETYAVPKARCEDFLRAQGDMSKWTIVRPVISFSERRFDLHMYSKRVLIRHALENTPVCLPESARNLTAGLDWSGNAGKLIASLLFREAARGEAFTISSAPNLTWGEVAQIYTDLIGLQVEWTDEETFLSRNPHLAAGGGNPAKYWTYIYDRKFDRRIDNSKLLQATGLQPADFTDLREGLCIELRRIGWDGTLESLRNTVFDMAPAAQK